MQYSIRVSLDKFCFISKKKRIYISCFLRMFALKKKKKCERRGRIVDEKWCCVQMYGRYTKDLGEYAKEEARKLKYEKTRRKYDSREEDLRKSRRGPLCRKLIALLAFAWKHTGARLGEDWVFLALLGIIMALISYAMDRGISMCNNGQFDNP